MACSLMRSSALAEDLVYWQAVATESARRLDEEQQRARAAKAKGKACADREAAPLGRM